MAKLQIDWTELASTRVVTGVRAQEDVLDLSDATGILKSADRQFERPILVYLTSGEKRALSSQSVVEGTTLKDERVAIASKFFTMVQDDGDRITRDHVFHRWIGGRKLPRFVVFTSDGRKVGKLEGRTSPSKLYGLMKKAVVREFVGNLDRTIKDYKKILTQLDRLSVLKTTLASKESRDASRRARKEVKREQAALAKEEEQLRAREQELFKFRRRKAA